MKRFFVSLMIALVPAVVLMFLFWIGGREFVRGLPLERISVAPALCFFWRICIGIYSSWMG